MVLWAALFKLTEMETNIIYNEDCFETLKRLGDNSIDAIVTDPPYSIGFMGKNWDKTGIAERVDLWQECLRVLKPGGNLLSFGGTRTYHRMICAIEDAGFEIRDCIMWVYGSGFPKSLDISKAIDKRAGVKREIIGIKRDFARDGANRDPSKHHPENQQLHIKTNWDSNVTIPYSPEAKLWDGYGTALKPAYEPIVLAMKPLDGTFAENALKYGVAGLNIDACRIPTNDNLNGGGYDPENKSKKDLTYASSYATKPLRQEFVQPTGRFPANFIHDGSQEVMELFPDSRSGGDIHNRPIRFMRGTRDWGKRNYEGFNDSGSAARFFYCAKASRRERDAGLEDMPLVRAKVTNFQAESVPYRMENGKVTNPKAITYSKNTHPTVKPLALMEYLVKLVTRPQHIVFDPFIGSGTTAMACVKLDRHYIGCELDKDYYTIALKRIKAIEKQ